MQGFTLNTRRQAVLNFDSIKVSDPQDEPRTRTMDNARHIVRNQTDKILHSVIQRKKYSMVQDKWALDENTGMTSMGMSPLRSSLIT